MNPDPNQLPTTPILPVETENVPPAPPPPPTSEMPMQSTSTPPPPPPAGIVSNPKVKWGKGQVIGTLVVLIVLVAGLAAGLILSQRNQSAKKSEAAGSHVIGPITGTGCSGNDNAVSCDGSGGVAYKFTCPGEVGATGCGNAPVGATPESETSANGVLSSTGTACGKSIQIDYFAGKSTCRDASGNWIPVGQPGACGNTTGFAIWYAGDCAAASTPTPNPSPTPISNPVPNCQNLTGDSTIILGNTGNYSADYENATGPLTRAGLVIEPQNNGVTDCNDADIVSAPQTSEPTTTGTHAFTWTPTVVGTYTAYCRGWNDATAECRGTCAPPVPPHAGVNAFTCAGPATTMTITVVAPGTPTPIPVPNCQNLTGNTTIVLGNTGTYTANYVSAAGPLTRAGLVIEPQNNGVTDCNDADIVSAPQTAEPTTQGDHTFTWTPAAVGVYTAYCRAWNDATAECRGTCAPPVPPDPVAKAFVCAGPATTLTITVIAPGAPTPTPASGTAQCQQVTVVSISRNGAAVANPTLALIQKGDVVTFRGFATATNSQVSTIDFTLTKNGAAQPVVHVAPTLVGNVYQADDVITIDQATSYSMVSSPTFQ